MKVFYTIITIFILVSSAFCQADSIPAKKICFEIFYEAVNNIPVNIDLDLVKYRYQKIDSLVLDEPVTMLDNPNNSLYLLSSTNLNFNFFVRFLDNVSYSFDLIPFVRFNETELMQIKNHLIDKFGNPKYEFNPSRQSGFISYEAEIFTWLINNIIVELEIIPEEMRFTFSTINKTEKERAEFIIRKNQVYTKPVLLKKGYVEIPDSLKYDLNQKFEIQIYTVEIDTFGFCHPIKILKGDSVFYPFIDNAIKDCKFKPALNGFGEPINSKMNIPFKLK